MSLLLTGCGSSSSQSLIGRESAKAIALHDAGLPEKWVIQMDVDYDKQDEAAQKRMAEEMKKAGYNCSFPFIKIAGACTQGYDPAEFERMLGEK